jgi:DNA repair photolyase
MVSSTTDPYQYIEQDEQVTRTLIPVLAARPDITVIIITKSDRVRRDFNLISEFPNVHLCMTITSLNDLPDLEPDSPGNKRRIECLREANAHGIYTIASIEPWIPKVTNPLQLLQSIHPFVKEVFIGSYNWHYRPNSEPEKDAVREYQSILPYMHKFLEDHMIRYTVKKELRQLILEAK